MTTDMHSLGVERCTYLATSITNINELHTWGCHHSLLPASSGWVAYSQSLVLCSHAALQIHHLNMRACQPKDHRSSPHSSSEPDQAGESAAEVQHSLPAVNLVRVQNQHKTQWSSFGDSGHLLMYTAASLLASPAWGVLYRPADDVVRSLLVGAATGRPLLQQRLTLS